MSNQASSDFASSPTTVITAGGGIIANNIELLMSAALVSANSAATDVAAIAIPSGITKYALRRVIFHTPSGAITTATFDLRTAANGGGVALVNAYLLSALTGAGSYVDGTLTTAATTTTQSAPILYVRNVAAEGSNKTLSVTLEIQPLP